MQKDVVCQENVFEGYKVRSITHNGEVYFSVVDIIAVLTDSPRPRRYWDDLKRDVLKEEGFQLSALSVQLKLPAEDGKMRLTDCANLDSIYEIMLDVRSKKSRPFKRWIAKIGSQFTQGKLTYTPKPTRTPQEAIEFKAITQGRKELTDVMKECGKTGLQIIGLTDQIYRGLYGKTAKEIRKERGYPEKCNLREYLPLSEAIYVGMAEEKAKSLLEEEYNNTGQVSSGIVGRTVKLACEQLIKSRSDFFSTKLLASV